MRSYFLILIFLSSLCNSQEVSKIKIEKEKCTAALLVRNGGNITKRELQNCDSIFLRGSCGYKIVSYIVTCCYPGKLVETKAHETKFTSDLKNNLQKLDIGNRFFVEDIKVMDLDGKVFALPDLIFKVTQFP